VSMAEPGTDRRTKAPLYRLKKLIPVISILVAGVLTLAGHLYPSEERARLASVQASAYTAIAQFAPWNFARRYAQIVVTQGNDAAEKLAEQQQRQANLFRGFACSVHFASQDGGNSCTPLETPHGIRAFYLSAHVPLILRFATAFFDMLLHALIDQGFIGFAVAASQIAIGILLTSIVIHRKMIPFDSFYSYVLGVPLAVIVLGSFAALPLWLLAFIGVTFFKALAGAGLGVQVGGTTGLLTWLVTKAAEEAGHHVIMKQIKRLVGD
jgi:hypothetical protein